MAFNPLSFFLTGFAVFFLLASPAHAFLGKDKIPVLKAEVKLSQAEFNAKTDAIEATPSNNKDLAYQIRLPKGWRETGVDVIPDSNQSGTEIFKQIASYTSPPRIEHSSIFRVRTIDVSSLMTVDDWFIGYMLQMGFSVEGMTIKSHREVMAQYILFEGGEPYVTRAVVAESGSRIILAEYLVHQEIYATERDEQILAMNSFALLSPNNNIPIPMKTFSFVDIAKFDYPASWSVRTQGISDIKRMDAAVVNTISSHFFSNAGGDRLDTQMAGRIDVTVVSKDTGATIADEVKLLNDGLKEKKYKLGSFIETMPNVRVNPLIGTSRVDVYQLDSDAQKLAGYEYWVAVLETKSRFYLVRLITISRGENYQIWAENTETYRFLLGSLGPASTQLSY